MNTPLSLHIGTCLLFSFLFFSICSAQNLVLNPSFEDVQQSRGEMELSNPVAAAIHWSTPNKGTPKLYGSNPEGNVHDEYGSPSTFKAKFGKHVAGIFVHGGGETDYSSKRDYIQGSLSQPLEVGKKYYFSFWVHYHNKGSNKIGIAFLPEQSYMNNPGLIRMRPATYQSKVGKNSPENAWSIVQDSFIAHKPFKHFIIGNFFRNNETELASNASGHHFAYIDDISVEVAPNQPDAETKTDPTDRMNWDLNIMTAQIMSNSAGSTARLSTSASEELIDLSSPQLKAYFARRIIFNPGSSILNPEEYEFLEVLVQQMKETPDFSIRIKGYANEKRSTAANLALSTARAEQIKFFFRDRGIDPGRLYIQALGKIEDPQDEDLGEAYNRRVDFDIINN